MCFDHLVTTFGDSTPGFRLRSETDHELRAALICLLTAALAHEGTAAIIGEAEGGWFWLPPWSREAFHGIRNSQRSIFFLNGNYRLLDKMCRALTPNCEASRYETRQRCGTEQIHVLPKDVAVLRIYLLAKAECASTIARGWSQVSHALGS
jgi:hypothetical protein